MRRDVPVASGSKSFSPEVGSLLTRRQWRQLLIITIGAICLYTVVRLLPTGTNLNHMDFRVQGKNSIEFCDPLNPQFIPVVAARSPVTLTVATAGVPVVGREIHGTLTLRTSSGKPIAPEDLLVVHTKLLHLMIVDPSLTDYQHVHPEPARTRGDWTFSFTPRFTGTYRLFADFTPVATARGLYANTDLEVIDGAGGAPSSRGAASALAAQDPAPPSVNRSGEPAGGPAASAGEAGGNQKISPVELNGYVFTLTPGALPLRARQPIDLTFKIAAKDGGRVPLQPIMGAYAHLVAFDSARSGFAHLHPVQADPLAPPAPANPTLSFKLTIPTAGRYVIWSQVNLAGHESFAPFWFTVE